MNAWHSFLASPGVEILGRVLLHFVWEGALLGVLAWVALRATTRRTAHARYLLACAALLLLAAAPCATYFALSRLASSPAPAAIINPAPSPTLPAAPPVVAENPVANSLAAPPPSPTPQVSKAPASSQPAAPPHMDNPNWSQRMAGAARWMVPFWLAGVLLMALRLGCGWCRIQIWRRRSSPAEDASLLAAFSRLANKFRLGARVRLLISEKIPGPLTLGWIKPAVLLPAQMATGLPRELIEALLAHELAHIARHDYLVNLLQSAVEVILFYHPAVWWIGGRIRHIREECCDELAVQVYPDRLAYARALESLAEYQLRFEPAAAAGGGSLLERIARIVGRAPSAPQSGARPAAGVLILSGLGIFLLAMLAYSGALAQQPSQAAVVVSSSAPRVNTAPGKLSFSGKTPEIAPPAQAGMLPDALRNPALTINPAEATPTPKNNFVGAANATTPGSGQNAVNSSLLPPPGTLSFSAVTSPGSLSGSYVVSAKVMVVSGTISSSSHSTAPEQTINLLDGSRMTVGTNATIGANTHIRVAPQATVTIDTVGEGTTLTLDGSLQGNGTIVKMGAGSLVANGNSANFTGVVVVQQGALVAGNGAGGEQAFKNGTVTLQGPGASYSDNGSSINDTANLVLAPSSNGGNGTSYLRLIGTGSGQNALVTASGAIVNNVTDNPLSHKISGPALASANQLLAKIRAGLPEGWIAGWDAEPTSEDVIIIESTNPQTAYFVNDFSLGVPEIRNYNLQLRVRDLISPDQAAQWARENAGIHGQLKTMADAMQDIQHFTAGALYFIWKTPEEKTRVDAYEALQGKLHDVPDYYFGDVALDWTDGSKTDARVTPLDTATADKAYQEVSAKIKSLLTPYPQK